MDILRLQRISTLCSVLFIYKNEEKNIVRASLTDDLARDKGKKKREKKTVFSWKPGIIHNIIYNNFPQWKLLCCPFTNHLGTNKIYPAWLAHNLQVPAFATGLWISWLCAETGI